MIALNEANTIIQRQAIQKTNDDALLKLKASRIGELEAEIAAYDMRMENDAIRGKELELFKKNAEYREGLFFEQVNELEEENEQLRESNSEQKSKWIDMGKNITRVAQDECIAELQAENELLNYFKDDVLEINPLLLMIWHNLSED